MILAVFLIVFLCLSSFILQCCKDNNGYSRKKILYDKIYLGLIFSLFYLLLAFRHETVGNDTAAYFDAYHRISGLSFSDLLDYEGRFEIGYLFINRILSWLISDPQFLLIITGIFILVSNARFIYRYSNIVWLSVLWYFLWRYFDANMNIIRQAIALGCILYSYSFLRIRRFWPFLLWVVIAACFHISAIVFIISWFVTKIRFRVNYLIGYVFGLLITCFLSSYFINLLFKYNIVYAYYIDSDYLSGGKIAPLLNLLVNLCIIGIGIKTGSYKYPAKSEWNKGKLRVIYDNNIMLNLLLVASFIQVIGLSFAMLERVAAYFQIFSIVFLPNSLKCIRRKEWYILSLFLVILVSIAYYLIIITYRPDWNKVYPYRFCF